MKIPFHPYPFYIGIEAPKGDIAPQKASTFRVAAVAPDGKPSDAKELNASLQRVVTHYSLVRNGNQTRAQKQEELVPRPGRQDPVSAGIGSCNTPATSGVNLLRASRIQSPGAAVPAFLRVVGRGGAGSGLLDRVVVRRTRPLRRRRNGRDRDPLPFKGLFHFSVEGPQIFRK
jgi:hypothetical protein